MKLPVDCVVRHRAVLPDLKNVVSHSVKSAGRQKAGSSVNTTLLRTSPPHGAYWEAIETERSPDEYWLWELAVHQVFATSVMDFGYGLVSLTADTEISEVVKLLELNVNLCHGGT